MCVKNKHISTYVVVLKCNNIVFLTIEIMSEEIAKEDLPDFIRKELESAIHIHLWKQLPDHAIQILEQAGYTKYDRNTDSIVFVEK